MNYAEAKKFHGENPTTPLHMAKGQQKMITFKQVMDEVKANGLTFKAKDGDLNVSAECFTDDPELLNKEAFFDVFTNWEVTAHSPITDTVIWGICHEIEKTIGGKWGYNAANNAIEQMTMA